MADTKITGLATASSLAAADLFAIADDPGGTPASRSVRADAIKTYIEGFGEVPPHYAITTEETAAAVTIVDYSKEPGHFLRYAENTTPGTTDMTAAIQAAIDSCPPYGEIKGKSGDRYLITDELAVTTPITINLNGSMLKKDSTHTGYVLSVSGTRRGAPDLYWVHPEQANLGWRTLADNNGFVLKNGILEGDARATDGDGIIFRGGNSDVLLDDLYIYGFKGTGIAACDPDGATGDDATNQYMQECLFRNVTIKNCGDSGSPAYVIGRNANGASNHNNLRHQGFNVVYARGDVAVEIINKNASANIQEVQFERSFVHGNLSLDDPDGESEATPTASDLVVIHGTGSTGTIRRVMFSNTRIIEQEAGQAALAVNGNTDVVFNGHYIASASGRVGISLNGAGNFCLSNEIGLELEDHIEIAGAFASGKSITVAGCPVSDILGYDGPNLILTAGSLDDVNDVTRRTFQYRKDADALAADETDTIVIGDAEGGETLLRAWYLPDAALTANDTDYASIIIRPYNANGTVRTTHTITTETSGSGGTGNWSQRIAVDLGIPSGTLLPGALAINITKSGNGVIIPAGVFAFQTSKALYI